MDGTYKALRIPIPILQQRCYNTARRLPKQVISDWTPPKVAVPVVKTGVSFFSMHPFLRKHYYKIMTPMTPTDQIVCRYCLGAISFNLRHAHSTCSYSMDEVLRRLYSIGKCVICKLPTNFDSRPPMRFDGAPVCSHECKAYWDTFNPSELTKIIDIVKEEKKNA